MISNLPIKIGIIGGIRAGKDTVANILVKELYRLDNHKETFLLSFADGIHDVIRALFPDLYRQGKPRKALQHIGQSMREIDKDVWVNKLLNSSSYSLADLAGDNIIITDVRQGNEAEKLKSEGFVLLKVVASKKVRLQRAEKVGDNFNPDQFEHETEVSVDSLPFDYMINNNGTLQDLTLQIRAVLTSIVKEATTNEL